MHNGEMDTHNDARVNSCVHTLGPGPYVGHLSDIPVTYEHTLDV